MLDNLDFAELVLPSAGYYALASFTRTPDNQTIPRFSFVHELDELVRNSRYADIRPNDTMYFSTASLVTLGSNQHNNLLAKQCLHIDIDIGHSGFVQTKTEAIQQVYLLCRAAEIPPPSALVSSGYGVHCYWSFTYAVPAKDISRWQQLSHGLVISAEMHAPTITKDISKWTDRTALLRMPGTMNKKQAQQRPVEVIGGTFLRYDITSFDNMLTYAPNIPAIIKPRKRAIIGMDGEALRSGCAVIKQLSERDGSYPYHAWRDIIHYSHHVDQGVQWAHDLSTGTAYNPKQLDSIYDYYVDRHEKGDYHPTGCRLFCANAGMKHDDVCRRCPLFNQNKSPVDLPAAKPLTAAMPTDVTALIAFADQAEDVPEFIGVLVPDVNCTYSITVNGTLTRMPANITDTDRGGDLFSHLWWITGKYEESQITYYQVSVAEEVTENRTNGLHAFVPYKIRTTRVKGEYFTDAKSLAKGLGNAGVRIIGDRRAAFEYAELVCALSKNLSGMVSSFGWQPDGRFVLGSGALAEDGTVTPIALGGLLKDRDLHTGIARNAVASTATEVGMIGAIAAFDTHSSDLGKALFLAAASTPLYKLIALDGYTILLYGPGGKGKSSIQRLLSCIYGVPDYGMMRGTDTQASWDATRGLYNSLPITFDEFTNAGRGTKALSDESDKDNFVMSMSDGRSKKVGSPEQRQRGGDAVWNTLCIGSTNLSYINSLKMRRADMRVDACLARVSEITLSGNIVDKTEWANIEAAFDVNHGLLGAKLVAYILANKAELTQRLLDKFAAEIGAADVGTEARFRIKVLVCASIIQQVIKAIGYADFKLKDDDIRKHLELHRFEPTRRAGKAWNSATSMGDFMQGTIGTIISNLQPRLLLSTEQAPGVYFDSLTQLIHGATAGKIIKELSGDYRYVIAVHEITGVQQARSFLHVLPDILSTFENTVEPLTEAGLAVNCVRILMRNGKIVFPAPVPQLDQPDTDKP